MKAFQVLEYYSHPFRVFTIFQMTRLRVVCAAGTHALEFSRCLQARHLTVLPARRMESDNSRERASPHKSSSAASTDCRVPTTRTRA